MWGHSVGHPEATGVRTGHRGGCLLPVSLWMTGEAWKGQTPTPDLCSWLQSSVPLRSLRLLSKDESQLG